MELQKYSDTVCPIVPNLSIKGVRLIDLAHYFDDGGDFVEISRIFITLSKGISVFKNKTSVETSPFSDQLQMNYSVLLPGTIKAFHIHKIQTDVWFIPPYNRVTVGLIDLRKDDKTLIENTELYSELPKIKVIMGVKPQLLVIPPGVAHGIANASKEARHMIYLVNQFWNPKDEWRIPWDSLGKEFWEAEKG